MHKETDTSGGKTNETLLRSTSAKLQTQITIKSCRAYRDTTATPTNAPSGVCTPHILRCMYTSNAELYVHPIYSGVCTPHTLKCTYISYVGVHAHPTNSGVCTLHTLRWMYTPQTQVYVHLTTLGCTYTLNADVDVHSIYSLRCMHTSYKEVYVHCTYKEVYVHLI